MFLGKVDCLLSRRQEMAFWGPGKAASGTSVSVTGSLHMTLLSRILLYVLLHTRLRVKMFNGLWESFSCLLTETGREGRQQA